MTDKQAKLMLAIGILLYIAGIVFFGFPEDDGFFFR